MEGKTMERPKLTDEQKYKLLDDRLQRSIAEFVRESQERHRRKRAEIANKRPDTIEPEVRTLPEKAT